MTEPQGQPGRYVWISNVWWDIRDSLGRLPSSFVLPLTQVDDAPASTLALLEDVLTRNGWSRTEFHEGIFWAIPSEGLGTRTLQQALTTQIEREAAS